MTREKRVGDLDDLDELLPGDQVRDIDNDVWQRLANGMWSCLDRSGLRTMNSADLLLHFSPLRVVAS
jgi:hypothetical protein